MDCLNGPLCDCFVCAFRFHGAYFTKTVLPDGTRLNKSRDYKGLCIKCNVNMNDQYVAGLLPPNYPLPAIRERIAGGGVAGDCVRVGAWFVDWSRGSIEVY